MAGLWKREDFAPPDLRTRAVREKDCRSALRLLAIANALEGMTMTEAAWLAGWSARPCTSVLALTARSNSLWISRRRCKPISCAGLSPSETG
ncbi:hypothetical protein [Microvirga arabica]|uniref:hypothetical protein n=1 Tax=Microvirga arabica TaxID=1128671 RepID=UPI00193A0DC7|nr:hypothetical protein [Microvirga arabica]MBM1174718.1 hypothetical protein [Microvirga arabica]